MDAATLERATGLARQWNVMPHEVLMANGWVRQKAYYRALALDCEAEFVTAPAAKVPTTVSRGTTPRGTKPRGTTPREALRSQRLRSVRRGREQVAYAPLAERPGALKQSLAVSTDRMVLTTPRGLRAAIERRFARQLMADAKNSLNNRFPGESAEYGIVAHQRFALAGIFAAICIAAYLAPVVTLNVLAGMATLFFSLVVALRLAACINAIVTLPLKYGRRRAPRISDADLPVYTVLVPLFRESAVLEALTQALMRLDYPAARLDIKLIFESSDPDTLAHAKTLRLPDNFEFIVVPDEQPRTKPKALNYALQFARGEYVVIYDAEDKPEPGQLRKALAAFAGGPPNLACLQARLVIYNGAENWLTRQFALEYGALFSGLLPTLQNLGLPILLGGTSNHFRISALKWLGGWDAFNVTEDADLGIRLYRHGYICRMLDSQTAEEAPCGFKPWLYQRTRWLKGWMQTYFVHMRQPFKLMRQLGAVRFVGLQVVAGGMIFSALVHPVFYLLLAIELCSDEFLMLPANILDMHVWLIALFNIAIGYLASMSLALFALKQKGARFALSILFMPAYWLLIPLAAYRALGQLVTRPFHWEKTEHGVSRFIAR